MESMQCIILANWKCLIKNTIISTILHSLVNRTFIWCELKKYTNLHWSACEEWKSHVGQTHSLVPTTSPIKVEFLKIMASIWWQYNTIPQVPILDMFKNILEKILINYLQLLFAWVICWSNCIWELGVSPCDNISDVFLTHWK